MSTVRYWLIIKDLNGKGSDSKTEITSWSSTSYSGGVGGGGSGGGPGKVDTPDISVTREVDGLSSRLMLACASGEHLTNVTIVVESLVGSDYRQFLRVEMSDVIISSFQTGGSYRGELKPIDQVKFSLAKIEYKYSTADDKPNATGRPDTGK